MNLYLILSLGAAPRFFYCLKRAALDPLPSNQLSSDWLPFIKVGRASSAVCLDIIKVQELKKKTVCETKSNLVSELVAYSDYEHKRLFYCFET